MKFSYCQQSILIVMPVVPEGQKHNALEPGYCNTSGGQTHGVKQSVELS
jgi:hypothetical protein